MSDSSEPSVEQLSLEGLERPEARPHADRYSFGGFLKSEIYDIFGDLPVQELTQTEIAWFSPQKLALITMQEARQSRLRDPRRFDGVLLSPVERKLLVFSPAHLGRRALDVTLSSRDIDEELVQSSRRSSMHAVENGLGKMQSWHDELLTRRSDVIELHGEARSPGYAHKRKERMHQLFSVSWTEMLNLADTLQEMKGYSDDKKARLLASAVTYLTTGPQSDRVRHWKKLLEFQKTYFDARIGIFDRQITRAQKQLDASTETL